MVDFPPLDDLVKRAQALATLDLIMSPEWESRYYSFNAHWSPKERMASMRNGCGDEWWLVFHQNEWAALKGVNHESDAWNRGRQELSVMLQALIPTSCGNFASEPAFRWDTTGFAYWFTSETGRWSRANDLTRFSTLDAGDAELICLLAAEPGAYVTFADEYFEREISISAVEDVYSHQPVTEHLVQTLNPEISIHAIERELYDEIGYPRP